MKKNLLASLAGISLALVVSIAANGQVASISAKSPNSISPSETPEAKSASPFIEASNVNQRAAKDLTRSFKNLSNERWLKAADGFIAKFSVGDMAHQVAYTKKGSWVYTIRTYDETKLPAEVRHMVRSSYYDDKITLVQEIATPGNPLTYIVHLEGKKRFINLRISEGEMEEWQKYVKSE
jgi:hypothetical protein